jgi:hypothetical protein
MWYSDDLVPKAIREAIKRAGPPLLLSDTAVKSHGVRPVDIKRWCQANLKSFIWMEEQDVSDAGHQHDYVYAFYIFKEEDRTWFYLKWSS